MALDRRRHLGALAGRRGAQPGRGDRIQRGATLGLMYDVSPDHQAWPEHRR